jgi:CHAT domain-containing protein
MATEPDYSLTPEQVAALVEATSPDDRRRYLQQAGLWHEDGLAALLAAGEQLLNNDLTLARQLLDTFIELAPEAAPSLHPQGVYLRAQTFAFNGEFEQALEEIAQARDGFQAIGRTDDALRTNVGLLNVLIHLGRYPEALDTAGSTLADIEQAGDDLPAETATRLTAQIRQNQAIGYKFIGRYAEAMDALNVAADRYRALDEDDGLATIWMNQGVILAELGRGSEALEAYEAAAQAFDRSGNRLRRAQILENMGELHLWLGNYNRSLESFTAARDLFVALNAPLEQYILDRLTADAYLALNLLPEATAAYRAAVDGLESGDVPYDLAWALWGLGATWLRRGQTEAATEALQRAADIFAVSGNEHLQSAVLLEQAALAEALPDRATAVQLTRRAFDLIAGQDWPVQQVYAHLRLSDLLLPEDVAAAESLLREAESIVAGLPIPHLRLGLQQRLGHLHLLQGRDADAEAILTTTIAEIEQLRGTLARQSLRTSFLQDKMAAFTDLIRLYLARGDEDSLQKAFNVAEQAKSRALADLISGDLETRLSRDLDPDLAQRIRTLQADLNAIYNEALLDNPEGDRATRLAQLNARATIIEEEISRLRLQVSIGTTSGQLPQFGPVTDLRLTLLSDQTLLAYHVLDDELMAFVYRDDTLHHIRQLARRPVIARYLEDLENEWQRFQADPAFIRRHIPRLIRSVRQTLQALHDALIAPLAGLLEGSTQLAIIPHGLLHHLPFAALFDGESYLVDQFELNIAPSATILNLSRQRPVRQEGAVAVFGVDDPLIPFALAEAAAVSRHLPQSRLHLGEQATIANLQTATVDCRLLHLACHGLFRRDNPFFSALRLHDGWLTAGDALELNLAGAFVTLSACESGRSEVIGGDELLGLPHAFLGAGAAGLLVSLWLVEDKTTASLMNHFYSELARGTGYPAALRRAQLALKSENPHPYYWAPFILIGA